MFWKVFKNIILLFTFLQWGEPYGRVDGNVCDATDSIPYVAGEILLEISQRSALNLPNQNLVAALVVVTKKPSLTTQHVKGLVPVIC